MNNYASTLLDHHQQSLMTPSTRMMTPPCSLMEYNNEWYRLSPYTYI